MKRELWKSFVLALVLIFGTSASGATPTAFELVEEGNRHIGESAQDKVVQIRSERSVGGVEPNVL